MQDTLPVPQILVALTWLLQHCCCKQKTHGLSGPSENSAHGLQLLTCLKIIHSTPYTVLVFLPVWSLWKLCAWYPTPASRLFTQLQSGVFESFASGIRPLPLVYSLNSSSELSLYLVSWKAWLLWPLPLHLTPTKLFLNLVSGKALLLWPLTSLPLHSTAILKWTILKNLHEIGHQGN